MKQDVQTEDKPERDEKIDKLTEYVKAWYSEKYGEEKLEEDSKAIADALYKLEKKTVRKLILDEGKRVDGRGI